MKFFDKDGNEVEAFTQEDLDAKTAEAVDEYKEANPGNDDELKKANNELAVAQAKLKEFEDSDEGGDGKNKDGQKARLIKERDDAIKERDEALKSSQDGINALNQKINGNTKNRIVSQLAGDDEELRAKIEAEYDNFAGDPEDDVEIQERLEKSYTLATGSKPSPEFMDGTTSPHGKGDESKKVSEAGETQNSKNIRNVFGITDQDVEKYGGGDK